MSLQSSAASLKIRRVDYFYTTVEDRPGAAYRILSLLLGKQVNLLAFSAIPIGPDHTQLVLYPEDVDEFTAAADDLGLTLASTEQALLIQGDDRLGALADIHARLYDAGVNVYSSNGVTDGRGGYGYVLHVKQADFERAARALGV
jgi:hypothetical protein